MESRFSQSTMSLGLASLETRFEVHWEFTGGLAAGIGSMEPTTVWKRRCHI